MLYKEDASILGSQVMAVMNSYCYDTLEDWTVYVHRFRVCIFAAYDADPFPHPKEHHKAGKAGDISTFVQSCSHSIGQASRPIISTNFGAGKGERIGEILKYAIGTAVAFACISTGLAELAPNLFVRIFMTPTEGILAIAPGIIRSYGLSFLLLPFNIFSTYYFQALMKPKASFIVSVSRGAVISGIQIILLPVVAGAGAIWFAMPLTELIVAVYE